METGHVPVEFGDPEQDPPQDHPLNGLIRELLSWFAAYYHVVKHDRKPPPPPPPHSSPSTSRSSSDPSPASSSGNAIENDDQDDEISKEEQARLVNFVRTLGHGRPAGFVEEDREKAAYLSTHHAMYEFLRGSLLGESWPPDDKSSEDQLPPDYSPTGKEDDITTKYTQKNNTAIGQASALRWGGKGKKRSSDVLADGSTSSNKRQKTSPLSGPPLHC
ncbi:hypothetical protein A0H81_06251 [Grifola frondosa]|uniref:Uncharacterized protein n=1 Tax=Grifola frondosa TaxID=5627 RepID=A0A1C7MAS8_GRIFR|nr:hypothetical protein A0H81_06251 [Grifola frondosa]